MLALLEKSNRDPARRYPYDIDAILSRTYAEAHRLERRTDATESPICPSLAGVQQGYLVSPPRGHSDLLSEYAFYTDNSS